MCGKLENVVQLSWDANACLFWLPLHILLMNIRSIFKQLSSVEDGLKHCLSLLSLMLITVRQVSSSYAAPNQIPETEQRLNQHTNDVCEYIQSCFSVPYSYDSRKFYRRFFVSTYNFFLSCVFGTGSHYVVLIDLELAMWDSLASN